MPISCRGIHDRLAIALILAAIGSSQFAAAEAELSMPPALGDTALDFDLPNLHGNTSKLSEFTSKGPVVLLVLRGYPGYQCPICSRQVGKFLDEADGFRKAGATILMVYPGPAEKLKEHAAKFMERKTLPEHFHLLVDPDYAFTNAWNLRWDAPMETAYPATYVIGRDGKIRYAKVSKSHAGRASAEAVLDVLSSLPKTSSPPADRSEIQSPPTVQVESGNNVSSAVREIFNRVRRHNFQPLRDGFTKDAVLGKDGIADLSNPDWQIRSLAVRDLIRLGQPAEPAILESLEDDNVHVRNIAILALGVVPQSGDFERSASLRFEKLHAVLQNDPDSLVRSEAAIALGRLANQESKEVLESAFQKDASRDVRLQCELALDRVSKKDLVADHELYEAYLRLDESAFDAIVVGEAASDLALEGTDGRLWKLSDFRGKRQVLLIWIFADWCPVCHGEFRDLIRLRDEFRAANVTVATIQCHESYRCRVMVGKEIQPKYWFAKKAPQSGYLGEIWWPHLADPAGIVGATYGVSPLAFAVHSEYINRPATVLIDKEGVVRFAYYGTFWGDRPTIQQTLELVRKGDVHFEHPKRLAIR